jgi:hypothetical protein
MYRSCCTLLPECFFLLPLPIRCWRLPCLGSFCILLKHGLSLPKHSQLLLQQVPVGCLLLLLLLLRLLLLLMMMVMMMSIMLIIMLLVYCCICSLAFSIDPSCLLLPAICIRYCP